MLLASPILIAFFFFRRAMVRRSCNSNLAIFCFALALALLVAPVPTPIITVFFPHGLALLDWGYYSQIVAGPFRKLWLWITISLGLTLIIALIVAYYYIRPSHKQAKSTPLPMRVSKKIIKSLPIAAALVIIGMLIILSTTSIVANVS